jgi:hypothetical protein
MRQRAIGKVTRIYDVSLQTERDFYDTLHLLVAGEIDHERDERNGRLYVYDVRGESAAFLDSRMRTLNATRTVARIERTIDRDEFYSYITSMNG